MQEYRVKAYGDRSRRLEEKEVIIPAADMNAIRRAWKMFPEYKEILVTDKNEYVVKNDFATDKEGDKSCNC